MHWFNHVFIHMVIAMLYNLYSFFITYFSCNLFYCNLFFNHFASLTESIITYE